MRHRYAGLLFSFGMTALLAGCSHSAPPATSAAAPPSPPVTATAAPSAQKSSPAVSTCTSPDDEPCAATGHAPTSVGTSGWTIVPPGGWMLAHKAGTTIAAGSAATIAVTTYDKLGKLRSRDDVLREVAAHVGVDLPTRKGLLPKRAHRRHPVAGVTVSFYQFEKIQRSQRTGVLVVFMTDLPSDAAVLGMAFVADGDKSEANQAIVRAVESLQPPAVRVTSPERPAVQKARLPSTDAPSDSSSYGLDLHPL